MPAVCPHCQSESPGAGEFCADCGKALPLNRAGPRILGDKEIASSATGQTVQADELKKKMRSAFGILLAIGIIQLILGILCGVIGAVALANNTTPSASPAGPGMSGADLLGIGIVMFIIGILFIGLAIWARWMPMAAAITGLTIYCLIFAADIIAAIVTQSSPGNIFIRIIVIGALAKAVQAGVQHRKLKRLLAAQGMSA